MQTPAEIILAKATLPTHLSSAEIRMQWSVKLREQAVFSARMTSDAYLKKLRTTLADLVSGKIDPSIARLTLLRKLREVGLSDPTQPPTAAMTDPASLARLNLILKTNRQTASSFAKLAQSEDPVLKEAFPAWELESVGWRKSKRLDWDQRWKAAGDSVGWVGAVKVRMAALKDSPIWQALGDGAGGFNDARGNAYPPFAINSSYDWEHLTAFEWRKLNGG